MSFPARYRGWCVTCKEPIEIDDLIRYTPESDKPVHADCSAPSSTTITPQVQHPVCTACWLTHPPGACDR